MGNEASSFIDKIVPIVQNANNDDIKKLVPVLQNIINDNDLPQQTNEATTDAQQLLNSTYESIQDEISTAKDQVQDLDNTLRRIDAAIQPSEPTSVIQCDHKTDCQSVKYLVSILTKYQQSQSECKSNLFDHVMRQNHNKGTTVKDTQQKPTLTHNSDDTYTFNVLRLLNAYQHILYQHPSEFEHIYNLLNEKIYKRLSCNLLQCLSFRRNHRDRFKMRSKGGLKELYGDNLVEKHFLDMVHCYFMHSFDTGNRLKCVDAEQKANDGEAVKLTQDITLSTKFITNAYSVGVRYYYWEYYKNKNQLFDPAACVPVKQHTDKDLEQTLGFWYIERKYANFKDEMVNNAACSIGEAQWTNTVQMVKELMQSNMAKTMLCFRKENQSAECYEMKNEEPMRAEHLIAAKIYTHFDDLQREFSQTFRKLGANETNEELKNRHSHYYFLGRYLREYVECFGMESADLTLYHGIQQQCTFPSIHPYIKGPFSTSKSYAVAVNFSCSMGMILELKIDKNAWRMRWDIKRMNCIDCQWLSEYANEQEVLFVGGINRHTFATIINAMSGDNYIGYVQGIRQMTYCMTNWNVPLDMLRPDRPTERDEKQMVFRLMLHEFYVSGKYKSDQKLAVEFTSCPPYITRLLHAHCTNVRAIVFGDELYPNCKEQNFIFKQFFQLENKWIDLERLMTIFPKLDLVFFQFEKFAEITKSLGITFEFMKNNESTIRMILVKVEKSNEMEEEVNKYRNAFESIGYNLRVRNIDEHFIKDFAKELGIGVAESQMLFGAIKSIDNVVNVANLIGKIYKVGKIQKFTDKHAKHIQANVQGLIVQIKKM